MTEEDLLLIRKNVEERKEKIRKVNNDRKRLKELEEDKEVLEYLKLRGIKKLSSDSLKEVDENDPYIAFLAFSDYQYSHKIEETNGIYMFVYKGNYLKGFKKKEYRYYRDIESEEEVLISDERVDEFESNNLVIYSERPLWVIQQEFINNALEVGQEETVKVMTKKYKK